MDDILKLAKDYSKERHLDLLPRCNNNILDKLDYIYDENWENQGVSYPYEILTYLFDSYYVLPERPDLAALFCWQAINHSYYVQQLSDNNVGFCQDTKGIELIRDAILGDWNNKYKAILEPFLKRMPDKTFHYVASYMLKGYAMEKKGIAEKYRASSYKTLKRKIPSLLDILDNAYGKSYCQISNPTLVNNEVDLGITNANKGKSRAITHSFGIKLRALMLGEEVEITFCDVQGTKKIYKFTEVERMSFVLFGILYASRCNNFHGNVAARMNSINANKDTFKMYTDMFLTEYRHCNGDSVVDRLMVLFMNFGLAYKSVLPSFHPFDLMVGLVGAVALKAVIYFKGKNAKKYRQGEEYGSARWGNQKDIEPFIDPVFENNVILTQTERLMMSGRPKHPKYARNKNVIVIGGSGSGKTRFYVKPNLMQMPQKVSYVLTDPKGTIIVECGKMLSDAGYKIKVLNTINFKKSMRYNPFHYIRSEKDILKLVNTIIANTKGDGEKSGEDFWVKAERLLYCALIGYIWYDAALRQTGTGDHG